MVVVLKQAEWCWAVCLALSTGCSHIATSYSLQILLLHECRWHTLNCYLFQGREEDQTLQNKTRRPIVHDWISSVWEPGGISQLLQASSSVSQSEAVLSCEWRFCQRDGSGELHLFVVAMISCAVFCAVCTQVKSGRMDWFRFSHFRAISGGASCTRVKAQVRLLRPCLAAQYSMQSVLRSNLGGWTYFGFHIFVPSLKVHLALG